MIRTLMDNWASFNKMDSFNISENCQSAVTKHFDEIIVVRARGAGEILVIPTAPMSYAF